MLQGEFHSYMHNIYNIYICIIHTYYSTHLMIIKIITTPVRLQTNKIEEPYSRLNKIR